MGMQLKRILGKDTTRLILLELHKSKNDYLLWSKTNCKYHKRPSKNGQKQKLKKETKNLIWKRSQRKKEKAKRKLR